MSVTVLDSDAATTDVEVELPKPAVPAVTPVPEALKVTGNEAEVARLPTAVSAWTVYAKPVFVVTVPVVAGAGLNTRWVGGPTLAT